MQGKTLGLTIFSVGVVLLFVHTTLSLLWHLVGIPIAYPLTPADRSLAALTGFTPAVGAALMVVGGLIYGRKGGR